LAYSRQLGIQFWYEFDRPFNPMFNGELVELVRQTSVLTSDFFDSVNPETGTLDTEKFKNMVLSHNIFEEISTLGNKQLELMDLLIDGGPNPPLQLAFEDFGQGVLYDLSHDNERTLRNQSGEPVIDPETKNPMIFRIHIMDSPGSYQWWHIFIRAHVLLGGDINKWFAIDKFVTLSYLIYSKVGPKQLINFLTSKYLKIIHNLPLDLEVLELLISAGQF
jgi:hypothetical protein